MAKINVEIAPVPAFMDDLRDHAKEMKLKIILDLARLDTPEEDFYLADAIADCFIGIYSSTTSNDPGGSGIYKEVLAHLFGIELFVSNPFVGEPSFSDVEFGELVSDLGWDIQHMQFREIYSFAHRVFGEDLTKRYWFNNFIVRPAVCRYVKSILNVVTLEEIRTDKKAF
jgi:hypothetical protein